jgi:hypothetical protein
LERRVPDQEWEFWDPPNTVVESTRQVLRDRQPITLVIRDLDAHRWQFLSDEQFDLADVMSTTLGELVTRDPTLRAIAGLPRGWHARRQTGAGNWRQQRNLPGMPDALPTGE